MIISLIFYLVREIDHTDRFPKACSSDSFTVFSGKDVD